MMPGLSQVLEITEALRPMGRRGEWRRLWHRHGPLLLIALGAGMLAGSYVVLALAEFGWVRL